MTELCVRNGQVWQSGAFTPASVLIRDGRIIDVSPGTVESPSANVVDATGRFVLPGFVDAHFHLAALALLALRCDLSGARCAGDVVDLMTAHADAVDGPVVGVEWDEGNWTDATFPTRAALDDAFAGRPAYARRICCHVGVVNGAFLQRFELPAAFVDADSGIIKEEAVFAANRLVYPPADAVSPALEGAIRHLHTLGITAIDDVVDPTNLEPYLEGLRASRARLRVRAMFVAPPDEFTALAERAADIDTKWFFPLGIKQFADGSLGAHSAALNDPYADRDTRGNLFVDSSALGRDLRSCVDQGIVFAMHAIGDRAIDVTLSAMAGFPSHTGLFRIEHAELIGPEQMDTLERLPVALCMQPNFVRNWSAPGQLYAQRLGPTRWRTTNPFASLERRGFPYFFGSDGMPPGPLYGIRGATHHPVEHERIDAASALARYTSGAIVPGAPADLTVLTANPLVADPDSIGIDATIVDGVVEYEVSQ